MQTNGNRRGASRAPTLWASHGNLRRCHALRAVPALGRKGLAALGAARVQDTAATLGCHPCAEAVAAGANKVRRLKSAFHRGYSGSGTQNHPDSRAAVIRSPVFSRACRPSQFSGGIFPGRPTRKRVHGNASTGGGVLPGCQRTYLFGEGFGISCKCEGRGV